jgi:hypothetical protein
MAIAQTANSVAEMFTMQRYLQMTALKALKVDHFDSWAATFGEPVSAMELAPDGSGKAPVDTPRRAMGGLLGHAVRFSAADDVLAAGEGIETMLSLRCALPAMPMAAALSANHLAALLLPLTLRRLYIARDADAAGDMALAALTERAEAAGIEALALSPRMGDFNEDLQAFGLGAIRAAMRIQIAPMDVCFFHR